MKGFSVYEQLGNFVQKTTWRVVFLFLTVPNCSNGMFAGCVSLSVLIIIPVSSNWFLHHINMNSHGNCMIEPQSNLKIKPC